MGHRIAPMKALEKRSEKGPTVVKDKCFEWLEDMGINRNLQWAYQRFSVLLVYLEAHR